MRPTNEFSDEELSLIASEFHRTENNTYLDHAGATLYSEKQIDEVSKTLKENLFSNPHTSQATEDLIDNVRYKILKFFNTDISEYDVVFTSGTTAALKIIAECFQFGQNGYFSYVQENHTSVLGMREIVETKNVYVLMRSQLLRNLNENGNDQKTEVNDELNGNENGNNLIVFSAQCNFSGFKYPLELIEKIQKYGLIVNGEDIHEAEGEKEFNNSMHTKNDSKNNYKSYVCLDSASFVGTNYLDLKKYSPDFVTISFYKIFGYPTGLGALLVSNRGQKVLRKKYFGGGTVKIAMSMLNFHEKRDTFYESFEDGTISFLSIISLLSGFSTIERLIPSKLEKNSMQRISMHVFELAQYCYNALMSLKYNNLKPVVKFYSHTNYTSVNNQGGIITFNLLYEDGSYVGFGEVACLAAIYNIYLRTGCFCNPGACQVFLELQNCDLKKQYQAGHICGDYNDLIDGVPTGAVRISFGYMSRKKDINTLVNMIEECYLKNSNNKRLEIIKNKNISRIFQNISERYKHVEETKSIRLREICIYPIKSCRAFKIKNEWELTENGLKYDRCWMIINSAGVAVTQKINSRLCLISPAIDESENVMKITFPGFKSVEISLDNSGNKNISSSLCQSKVCGDLIEGYDCGDEVADWLCECLSMSGLRLIQQRTDVERKSRSGKVKHINLSNQAQFLLINYTSVAWLASKVNDWSDNCSNENNDLDNIVDRFRGNFIIETSEPMEENSFEQISFGEIQCKVDGACNRCQMICIDPKTGLKTAEPLRTITKEFQGKMRFGIYLSQEQQQFVSLIEDKSKKRFISCNNKIFIEKLKKT